jgi:serine-type D-Ala-D-Ala carboxypeptidase/endopeptidase (penicillin-binding protein 4)
MTACSAISSVAIATIAGALWFAPAALAQGATTEPELRAALAAQVSQGPAATGAYVVDLSDGHVVFDDRAGEERLSASVTKLYTTATTLLELGPRARVATRVLGTGRRDGATWTGDVYLRGAGDFTFGTRTFARRAYGSRASVQRLAAALRRSGLRRIRGDVLGDATLYSDNGGTPFDLVLCSDPLFGRDCPYGPAGRLERPIPNGPRTPIGYNRGLTDATGAKAQHRPARL